MPRRTAEASPESGNAIWSFPSEPNPARGLGAGWRSGGDGARGCGLWAVGGLLIDPKPLREGHTP